MNVFFYGLFMDEDILASKGINPTGVRPGFADGYGLRIGERATLVQHPVSRAWGVLMDITASEAHALYAEESVADYLPEQITIQLLDGTSVEATCYNLPADKVTGTNSEYAKSLLKLATQLGFPENYLARIRQFQVRPETKT